MFEKIKKWFCKNGNETIWEPVERDSERKRWDTEEIKRYREKAKLYQDARYMVKFWFRELKNWDIEPIVKVWNNIYWFSFYHSAALDYDDHIKFYSSIDDTTEEYLEVINRFVFYVIFDEKEADKELINIIKSLPNRIRWFYQLFYNIMWVKNSYNWYSYFEYKSIEDWLEDLNKLWDWFIDYQSNYRNNCALENENENKWMETKRVVFSWDRREDIEELVDRNIELILS